MDESSKILIVDDEETFLYSTADLLRREGFECHTALEARTAADLLATHTYDLLIADIKMPGNTGLEFVTQISTKITGLPVILVTGYPTLDSAIRSIRLPVVAYLIKPLDFEELLTEVRRAVENTRLYRSIRASRQRLQSWSQELEKITQPAANLSPDGPALVSVNAFLALTLRNIASSLDDLQHLTETLARQNEHQFVCRLLHCPRVDILTQAIHETIDVLEKTKTSFKSKDLRNLRLKLEQLVGNGSGGPLPG